MDKKLLIFLFYSVIASILIMVNDQAVWFVFSGVLLVFEWQIICAVLFGLEPSKRLVLWQNIRLASHIHYFIVLVGAFFAIKEWFPDSNNIGLIILGTFFFSLKELSLRVCKYKAIMEDISN